MTAPLSPWPPTKETLERHANWLRHVAGSEHLEAFLRDPRLLAALALWEAVEWLHTQERTEFTSKGHAVFCPHGWTPDALWWVRDYRYPGDDPRNWSRAATLPEAVSALRARLEKESSRG